MTDLRSVRIKIDRAKKHLADLDNAIRAFESREPFDVITETQAHTRYEIYRFLQREPIPFEWGAIVGDCIHNLRSSLDHLAVALVIDGGGTPTNYTTFPISPDVVHFQSSAIRRLNGASAGAIKLVRKLKPYTGGNKTLSQLHLLDIRDKHVLLIPVAAAYRQFAMKLDVADFRGYQYHEPVRWLSGRPLERKFPVKDSDQIFSYKRAPADMQDNSEFQFAFEIAFGEGQIVDGEAVVPTLEKLVDFTERLIDIFARRILKVAW